MVVLAMRNMRQRIVFVCLFVPLMFSLFSSVPLAQAAIVSHWDLDRPKKELDFSGQRERAENATTNDEASVGIGAQIEGYYENKHNNIYEGGDGIELSISATANTRKGIDYECTSWGHLYEGWLYTGNMNSTGITGDNSGAWIPLPEGKEICFYGGGEIGPNQNRSAYYNRIWVCSNGFISFTSNSNASNPPSMPSSLLPNAVIAPYWTDLDPSGGSIKYSYYNDPCTWAIAVVWDHVLNKNNQQRETFGVIMEYPLDVYPLNAPRGQSRIRFLYNNVSGYPAVVGLEDQEGKRACTPGFAPSGVNELWFDASHGSPGITKMKIIAWKDDTLAQVKVSTDTSAGLLRGYNLDWTIPQQDTPPTYEVALSGGASLLVSEAIGIGNPFGGLIWGSLLLGYDVLHSYAMEQWPVNFLDHRNALLNGHWAFINASAGHFSNNDYPVDATLDDTFFWVFNDTDTVTHSINLYAEVEYYSYRDGVTKTLSTKINLQMTPDICDDFSNPKNIDTDTNYKGCLDTIDTVDTYVFSVPLNVVKIIGVTMTPAYDANYDIYLYNPSHNQVASSTNGGNASESINYYDNGIGGNYYVKVILKFWPNHNDEGIYRLKVTVGTPTGGCPYVYTWNGSQYVIDNNILPTSESNNGSDVEDQYKLEQTLAPRDGKYSLLIGEFEHEHSYLDQVKLLAVDHDSNVQIAVDPRGQFLTYKNLAAPVSAVDNYGYNRLSEIRRMDGNISNPTTFFYGNASDYLILNFGRINSNDAKLIVRDDQKCELCCIDIQVLNGSGQWYTVVRTAPRNYWAVEGVDLSSYVVKNRDFKVRLLWTASHKLDFAGLDTTKQADYQVTYASLISATHSTQGDVTSLLTANDNQYAELIPGQQIQIDFTLPSNQREARTYILYTEGHYCIIR